MDGFGLGAKGEPLSGQIFRGKEGKLTLVESVPIWGSLGFYYGAVTLALGFKLNDGEGKTMGLAAYGNWRKCYGAMGRFFPSFRNKRWVVKPSIMDLLNIPRKEIFAASPTFLLLKNYIEKYGRENVAAACQKVFEEELMKYLKYLVAKYKIRKLNLVGGIFLNVKANMKILEEEVADEIFIYPNPTDGGTAAGAALVGYLLVGGKFKREELLHPAFGRSFSDTEILKELKKIKGVVYRKIKRNLPELTAQLLAKQKVVGWFQGRGEWGPRALGQRSVLADPRNLANKDRINDILKGREWFMPFAPSMLVEAAPRYLKMLTQAPFMIIADRLKKGKDKDLIAAIHVDKTVRPHMVTAEANPLYYDVIKEFAKITGVAAILNTSFNKHGLPIVYTPKEAIEHLLWKTIDVLVIGNYLVQRKK
jgi:carbamoyltransferase